MKQVENIPSMAAGKMNPRVKKIKLENRKKMGLFCLCFLKLIERNRVYAFRIGLPIVSQYHQQHLYVSWWWSRARRIIFTT